MDGFKRPAKPQVSRAAKVSSVQPPAKAPSPAELPAIELKSVDFSGNTDTRPAKHRRWPFVVLAIIIVALLGVAASWFWYQGELRAVNLSDDSVQRVEITDGASLGYLAERLEERGIIRNGAVFKLFATLSGKQSQIKAGTCNLKPSNTAAEVLDKITAGCHDFKSVTFYPGATLEASLYAKSRAAAEGKEFKDMSIRASLKSAGYDNSSIDEAFSASYSGSLFEGKPASADYEGYVFGETYYVATNASAKEVLQVAFDHFSKVVEENNLREKFQQQGLSLYEGITLASIVGRELDCEGKPTEERKQRCYGYQQQIAEVFHNRLKLGMSLGSDVTSIYAADKLGVTSSVDVDSPYNTRKYPGLTPGPIATAGRLALLSTANPTVGDDLFFLAGDDGLIYFATDNAGHEANIRNHCKEGCGDL